MHENNIGMVRLLVHLHLYYQEQTDYFLDKLKNITVPYQLIVTLTTENESIKQKIATEIPNTKFLLVENCGYDVYPFFQAMKQFDLSTYDYILKIHTKNSRNTNTIHHLHFHGNEFRDNLIAPLIGSRLSFKRVIRIMKRSPKTGIICTRYFLYLMKDTVKENRKNTRKLCQDYNIPYNKYNKETVFCAGTIFLCRSEIVRFLLKNNYTAAEYGHKLKTGIAGTLAHSMEEMFGITCNYLGYKTKGIQTLSKYLFIFLGKCIAHKEVRWLLRY